MVNVTAATSFFGNEGMWRAGETKSVSAHRAHELIEEGLAIESANQTQPRALEQAAAAIGATVAEPDQTGVQAVAEALGATVVEPVTTASLKASKKKPTDPTPGPSQP